MLINSPNISGSLTVTGNSVISGSLTVLGSITGAITGSATTASYVEYSNVANKPALVSGSSQITYSGLTGIPSGIVSGSSQVSFNGIVDKPTLVSGSAQIDFAGISNKPTLVSGSSQISFNGITDKPTLVSSSSQITYSGLTGIPSGIVSGSAQVAAFGYATTGSNTFIGNQIITGSILGSGSLTIDGCITATGQIVAQTINVQQVTSSIVYSCGSNIFGTSLSNTQQFTGSMFITGSNLNANVGSACFQGSVCASSLVVNKSNPILYINAGNNEVSTIGFTQGAVAGYGGFIKVNTGLGDRAMTFGLSAAGTNNDATEVVRIDDSGVTCFLGAVCAPSIITNSATINGGNDLVFRDASNYISSPATDTLRIVTANAERLRITATGIACFACQVCAPVAIFSGCVGIGNTIPIASLDTVSAVTGTYAAGTQQLVARFYNSPASLGSGNNSAFLSLQTTPDGGNSNPVARIGVVGESYGTNLGAFVVATRDAGGVTERMRITSGGDVFIGATNCIAGSGYSNRLSVKATALNTWGVAEIRGYDSSNGGEIHLAGGDTTYVTLVGERSGVGCGAFYLRTKIGAANEVANRLTITNTGIACFACQVCTPKLYACVSSDAAIVIDGYSKLSFADRGTEYGTINASRYNFGGESTMMTLQSSKCFLFLNGLTCLMFINSANGNVGVGTTSPLTKLHVIGSISAEYSDSIYLDYSPSEGSYKKGFSGLNQSTSVARGLHIFNYDNDSNQGINFWVGTNASKTQAAIITSTGLVGLNQPSPSYRLEICSPSSQSLLGLMSANGVNIDMVGYGTSLTHPQSRIQMNDDGFYGGNLSFFTKPNGAQTNGLCERMRITSAGLVGINTTNFGERLNIGCGGAIGWQNTCNCQRWHIQYRGSEDGLNFVESAVADFRLFLKAGGSVGIGTGNPTAALTIRCDASSQSAVMEIATCFQNAYRYVSINAGAGISYCIPGGTSQSPFIEVQGGDASAGGGAFRIRTGAMGSVSDRLTITQGGVSCFIGTVCAPIFRASNRLISNFTQIYNSDFSISPGAGRSVVICGGILTTGDFHLMMYGNAGSGMGSIRFSTFGYFANTNLLGFCEHLRYTFGSAAISGISNNGTSLSFIIANCSGSHVITGNWRMISTVSDDANQSLSVFIL